MATLNELFHIRLGNRLDLNKMTRLSKADGGVNFVGRSSENHGISATVQELPDVDSFKSGLITVALGGAKILSAFVQDEPFYTAQNVAVLTPRVEMSFAEKVYVCMCIRHNRWRYSAFGREANRTLRDIAIPPLPTYLGSARSVVYDGLEAPALRPEKPINNPLLGPTKLVSLDSVFNLRFGHSLELNRLERAEAPSGVNFIGRAMRNNGVTARVQVPIGVVPGKVGELTVALSGNGVLSTFVQPEKFLTTFHVMILTPRDPKMTLSEKLWWSRCIYANRYRFSFGRQANRTLAQLSVPLPKVEDPSILIERFMRTLPFATGALADEVK